MKISVVVCACVLIGVTYAATLPFVTESDINDDTVKNALEKRSIKLPLVYELGAAMILKGLRATRQLLAGAKKVLTYGNTREYEKIGNADDAFQDFMAQNPGGVRIFRAADGCMGKVGQVGDRQIKVISRNADGKPAIEITKIDANRNTAEITRDIITYKKSSS